MDLFSKLILFQSHTLNRIRRYCGYNELIRSLALVDESVLKVMDLCFIQGVSNEGRCFFDLFREVNCDFLFNKIELKGWLAFLYWDFDYLYCKIWPNIENECRLLDKIIQCFAYLSFGDCVLSYCPLGLNNSSHMHYWFTM